MASLAHFSALPSLSWAARFRFRQHLRQSLWAVPLVGTLVGLALARLDLWLEPKVDLPAPWTYSASTRWTHASSITSGGRSGSGK